MTFKIRKIVIGAFMGLLTSVVISCDKEEKLSYRMSGIYLLPEIEQIITTGDEKVTTIFENPGFLYLKYDGFNGTPLNPGVLNVSDEVETALYCIDEIGEETIFDWAIFKEQLIWERSYNEFGWPVNDTCFFDINKEKRFEKVIKYSETRINTDGVEVFIEETFYMQLKRD